MRRSGTSRRCCLKGGKSITTISANFCFKGNSELYEYCLEKDIGHKRLGKLIVASNEQESIALKKLYKHGLSNGVELRLLKKKEVEEIEPDLMCESAIFSPNTGIIDVPEYIDALEGDIQNSGGIISYRSEFLSAKRIDDGFKVTLDIGEELEINSKILINCTGLLSDYTSSAVADLNRKFIRKVYYGKGHYFKFMGPHPFKRLIYPVPQKGGLGIHVTMDMSNQLKFGPNVEWVSNIDYDFDTDLKDQFLNSIKKYWPGIDEEKIQPDYCGIRPKIYGEHDKQPDFCISSPQEHGLKGFYNLQGIESPGLTSALPIAKYIYGLITG